MNSFGKTLALGTVWRFFFYLSGLLLNIILANYLGAAESGHFFYVVTNLSIIISFLSLGLDTSLSYFHSQSAYNLRLFTSISFYWSLFATIIFFLFFSFSKAFNLFQINLSTVIICLYVFGSLLFSYANALFYASNKHFAANLLPTIINVILLLYLILFHTKRDFSILTDFAPVYFLAPLMYGVPLFLALNNYKLNFYSATKCFSKKIFNYSFHIYIVNLLLILFLRCDIWIVEYFSTAADLGNYIQTTKVLQIALFIPNLASFVLLPLFTRNTMAKDDKSYNVVRLVNVYFYLSAFFCLLFVLLGKWLFPLVFGPSFNKMYLTFLFSIPGILAFPASYPLSTYYSGSNQNRFTIKAALPSIILMLALDAFLVPLFSIYGAAIASSVSYVFYFLMMLNAFRRKHPIPLHHTFSVKIFYRSIKAFFL